MNSSNKKHSLGNLLEDPFEDHPYLNDYPPNLLHSKKPSVSNQDDEISPWSNLMSPLLNLESKRPNTTKKVERPKPIEPHSHPPAIVSSRLYSGDKKFRKEGRTPQNSKATFGNLVTKDQIFFENEFIKSRIDPYQTPRTSRVPNLRITPISSLPSVKEIGPPTTNREKKILTVTYYGLPHLEDPPQDSVRKEENIYPENEPKRFPMSTRKRSVPTIPYKQNSDPTTTTASGFYHRVEGLNLKSTRKNIENEVSEDTAFNLEPKLYLGMKKHQEKLLDDLQSPGNLTFDRDSFFDVSGKKSSFHDYKDRYSFLDKEKFDRASQLLEKEDKRKYEKEQPPKNNSEVSDETKNRLKILKKINKSQTPNNGTKTFFDRGLSTTKGRILDYNKTSADFHRIRSISPNTYVFPVVGNPNNIPSLKAMIETQYHKFSQHTLKLNTEINPIDTDSTLPEFQASSQTINITPKKPLFTTIKKSVAPKQRPEEIPQQTSSINQQSIEVPSYKTPTIIYDGALINLRNIKSTKSMPTQLLNSQFEKAAMASTQKLFRNNSKPMLGNKNRRMKQGISIEAALLQGITAKKITIH